MTYTLKNVKTLDTSDGQAMTASIYLDGKRVGIMENSGRGGCDMYHFGTIEDGRAFTDAAVNAVAFQRPEGLTDFRWENDACELFFSDLLMVWETQKAAKKFLLFRLDDEGTEDGFRTLAGNAVKDRAGAIAWLQKKYAGRTIKVWNIEDAAWVVI